MYDNKFRNVVSTEMLVSCIMGMGFDTVDPMLYGFVLGKIQEKDYDFPLYVDTLPWFEIVDRPYSDAFKSLVNYSGNVFKLKPGITTNMMYEYYRPKAEEECYELAGFVNKFFKHVNLDDFILQKSMVYGNRNPDNLNSKFFSSYELAQLKRLLIDKRNSRFR